MFADEVFVFTPKGDVIILPAGATPIDFAYKIHSAVGNRMVGAKVNGKLVPFEHILQNGDIVEVITSKTSKGPGRDWINIAKSSEASKIKQWFKKEKREENIAHGKAAFEAEMKRNHLNMTEFVKEEVMQSVLKKLSFGSVDEMYAAIGFGGITAVRAVSRVREELIKLRKLDKQEKQLTAQPPIPPAPARKICQGIMVEGLENCLIKFARCCTPVPDEGCFITRDTGIVAQDKVSELPQLQGKRRAGDG